MAQYFEEFLHQSKIILSAINGKLRQIIAQGRRAKKRNVPCAAKQLMSSFQSDLIFIGMAIHSLKDSASQHPHLRRNAILCSHFPQCLVEGGKGFISGAQREV